MSSPTPETDAEWDRLQRLPGGGYSSQVAGFKLAFGMFRWASEIELQRDEARELARELQSALITTLASLIIRMGPEDVDTVENAHHVLGKAKQLLKP